MASVFDLLDREWARLGSDQAAARRLRAVCDLAGNATTLDGLERHVRSSGPETADRVLLALATRVVNDGDELAARVLLQLLLPGTRNLARRWWALGDPDERAAAAVSAVYGRIRTYPLARRPGRIAANVLLDAARDLRRQVPRVVATAVADPAAHHGSEPVTVAGMDPATELAQVLADAVNDGVLGLEDAQLIAQSRIGGHRVADIAAGHRLGTRALWDRRQRAEARLAAMVARVA
jgi:DNA-directed RNA polymerase specialized sigma24 family protein